MAVRAREPLRRGGRREHRPQPRPTRGAAQGNAGGSHPSPRSRAPVLALRRALGKSHPRVVGVDDGAFARTDRHAPIAAVLVSLPDRVESVQLSRVRVDGRDGTDRIISMVRRLRGLEGVRAVLLDGAVVGGFNVVDLDGVRRALGMPVVALTRRAPDFPGIRAALTRWFPRTAAERWGVLRRHRLFRVPTGGEPLWAAAAGCTAADAALLVRRSSVLGYWPEPLRLAHLVASAARRSDRTLKPRRSRASSGPVA